MGAGGDGEAGDPPPHPHSHHYQHHNHCHHLTKSIDAITVKLHHGVLLSARTTSKQYIFCRVHS